MRVSGEVPLLVVTEPVLPDGDGEWVRVALDVLRASADVKVASPATPHDLWQSLDRRGRRRPVVVGGDRLLHGVVQTLHGRSELARSVLGWVPLPTRQNLAVALGLPLDPAGAARVVVSGAERWLDLLVDDAGGIAVESVCIGAAATGAQQPSGTGMLARAASRLGSLRDRHRGTWRLRVEADGTVLAELDRGDVVVGLGPSADPAGGETPATTGAGADEGLAEVTVSGSGARRGRRGQPSAAGRDQVRLDRVQVLRAKAVTVSGRDFPYTADGVRGGPVRRRTWTVERGAWGITVPVPT